RLARDGAVCFDHFLAHDADLALVRDHAGPNDDRFSWPELLQELQRDTQDGRAGLGASDHVDAETAFGDEIPASLFEELEIASVVEMPEGIEVRLADGDDLLVYAGHTTPILAPL